MKQIRNLGDERQTTSCIYCGRETDSREHVPSKILLDEPYPENLPVIPSCKSCSNSFSLDEEYFTCILECSRIGSLNY